MKLRKEYSKDNRKLDTKPKEEIFKTLNQVIMVWHGWLSGIRCVRDLTKS